MMRRVWLAATLLAGCMSYEHFRGGPAFAPAQAPAGYGLAYIYSVEEGVGFTIRCGERTFDLYGYTHAALLLRPGRYTCQALPPLPKTFSFDVTADVPTYLRYTFSDVADMTVAPATGAAEIARTTRAPGGRARIVDDE